MGVPAARRRRSTTASTPPLRPETRRPDGRARSSGSRRRAAVGNVAYFYPPLVGPLAPRHPRSGIKGHEDWSTRRCACSRRARCPLRVRRRRLGPGGRALRRQLEEQLASSGWETRSSSATVATCRPPRRPRRLGAVLALGEPGRHDRVAADGAADDRQAHGRGDARGGHPRANGLHRAAAHPRALADARARARGSPTPR